MTLSNHGWYTQSPAVVLPRLRPLRHPRHGTECVHHHRGEDAADAGAWSQLFDPRYSFSPHKTSQLLLTVLPALFFAELKFSDYRIGLFMTLTLLGDVFLGGFLTLIADRVGRRKVLIGGSFLMVLSGTVFANFDNFWILLVAAVLGVVSATGGDFGPFRSIEEYAVTSPINLGHWC